MKRLATLCLLAAPLLTHAQSKEGPGRVAGQLRDEHAHPLPFATVLLQALPDTTRAQATQAGADGHFAFAGVAAGRYRVVALALGYCRQVAGPLALTPARPTAELPALTLQPGAQQLAAVRVTGQRPLLEMTAGKLLINVAASPAAAGGTALEALQQVPGLLVQGNRLSLAGREGLTILLDGRTTHYTDVVALLRDLPGANIERIEVLTQPGAQHDAAGSAGIINIMLKQNTDLGTNATLALSGAYGRFGKGGGNLDFNHRAGRLNGFGSYGYGYRPTYEQLNTDRLVGGSRYEQRSYQPRTAHVNTARLGADYALGERQTLGVLLSGSSNQATVRADNGIVATGANGARTDTRTSSTSARCLETLAANLNYRLAFTPQRSLTVDADASGYRAGNDVRLTNDIATEQGTTTKQLGYAQPTRIGLASGRVDYQQPLGKAGKLAAGVKASAANIDSRLDFAPAAAVGSLTADHFTYQERLAAAYVSGEWAGRGLQVQGGLRGEQTHALATSVALGQAVPRNYFQLFPSLSVQRALGAKLAATASFSRRIDRPSYQDLNPSVVYLDPYSQQRGNPLLGPQLSASYQAGLTWQQQPVLLLAYTRTSDAISLATGQQDSVVYSTTANLGRLDYSSATLNFPLRLGKRLSGYGGTVLYYNHYRAEYLGGQYQNGRVSATFYLQAKVALPRGAALEVSGYAQTGGVNGLLSYRPFGSLNLGLQKSFCRDQLQLRLALSDAFFTSQQRGTVQYQHLDVRFFTQSESRQLRLSVSYKLGNQALKAARKRGTGLDEERGRVKSE